MNSYRLIRAAAAVPVAAWSALIGSVIAISPASAAPPCPDVEVVFARGTGEPAGVGGIGQAFVDAVQAQAAPRSVDVYPVNYAASSDFGDRDQFARTVIDGIRDAATHIESTAANCPSTRIVLGGYSQGAALAGYTTVDRVPPGVPAGAVPAVMPPQIAKHVAAVALFGTPSDQFLSDIGAPPLVIGPLYAPKTIKQCAPDDTICNGAGAGGPSVAHALYAVNGSVDQAASFTVSHL